ncbi:MAG: flotillin-like protein FloA [Oligosphaeraceae bacterium]|nr:flotillin-like protein FloA [Oligosphaeraceae bacterium]
MPILLILGIVAIIALLVIASIVFHFFGIWIQAWASGAAVSFVTLVGMSLRKIPPALIVRAYIQLRKAGIMHVSCNDLECHYMAGGDVLKVVNALIAADKAGINLDFMRAAAIDLAGRNVFDAVCTSVNPRVIDCPDPTKGRVSIDAVAKDGIQVKAKARVTVRTNLDRLVGGATEETIIARVGEGIVSTIGSSESYTAVLENPDLISKRVQEKGLDSGTAFEILSIDIADVDIGDNVGARLQAEQAEADTRVAQAKAEVRRAAAVALEQEMLAKVQEMQANVTAAQAEVPLALAAALREGKMGVLDYYRLENIKADTEMRKSIGGDSLDKVQKSEG